MCYNILSSRLISLVTLLKEERERLTWFSSAACHNAIVSRWSFGQSPIVVCDCVLLPQCNLVQEHNSSSTGCADCRRIQPQTLFQLHRLFLNLKSDFHILVMHFSYLGTFAKQTLQFTYFEHFRHLVVSR